MLPEAHERGTSPSGSAYPARNLPDSRKGGEHSDALNADKTPAKNPEHRGEK